MNPEQMFLAAILADPADDHVRLAYSDWLEERGAPGGMERAEFIRLQIEDAQNPLYPDSDERQLQRTAWIRARMQQLIRATKVEDWSRLSSAFLGGSYIEYRRGFIAETHCTLAAWIGHGPAIVRAQPVEVVRLSDRNTVVHRRSPELAEYLWHREGWGLPSSQIPATIFDTMTDTMTDTTSEPQRIVYCASSTSMENAVAWLSLGCLKWAKAQCPCVAVPTSFRITYDDFDMEVRADQIEAILSGQQTPIRLIDPPT